MEADDLRMGDPIRQADGSTGTVWLKWEVHKTQEMYNLTVDTAHTFYVGEGQWLVHNACKPGQAGAFDSFKGVVGDKLTPHHMPQAAQGFTPYEKGGALVMHEAEHMLTRTFRGKGAQTLITEAGLGFRDILAKDIWDVKKIVGTKYNPGLKDLLTYYRKSFPKLMYK